MAWGPSMQRAATTRIRPSASALLLAALLLLGPGRAVAGAGYTDPGARRVFGLPACIASGAAARGVSAPYGIARATPDREQTRLRDPLVWYAAQTSRPAARGWGEGRQAVAGDWLAQGLEPVRRPRREAEPRRSGNSRALVPALMSAVVPGAGQVRNGSTLRGLAYFMLEVTGWVAYGAFHHGGTEKKSDYASLAERSWDYDRYYRRATDQDSCDAYAWCPCNEYTDERDEEIQARMASSDPDRFYEYITREAYACGWDASASRSFYRRLWNDRQDLLDAKSWTGRAIFLNHFISAIDAFLEARRVGVEFDSGAELRMHVRSAPWERRSELCLTCSF